MQRRGIDSSTLVSQEDKEEFWEVLTSELLLEKEALDKMKELNPFEVLMKSKVGSPLPNWSSFVSGSQKPSIPPHISSSSYVSSIPIGFQKPSSPPHISSSSSVPVIPVTIIPPLIVATPARHAPLVLSAILHDLPSKYAARIPT